jgi:hypothetical protein
MDYPTVGILEYGNPLSVRLASPRKRRSLVTERKRYNGDQGAVVCFSFELGMTAGKLASTLSADPPSLDSLLTYNRRGRFAGW